MKNFLREPVFGQPLIVLSLLIFTILSAGNPAGASEDKDFKAVEIDRFIERNKSDKKGEKLITLAKPVSFEASLKRYPEEKDMNYVYIALAMAKIDPIPEVEYQMFLETAGGHIFSVYIPNESVKKIRDGLQEGDHARFYGYHLYSYSKGPAIMIADFKKNL